MDKYVKGTKPERLRPFALLCFTLFAVRFFRELRRLDNQHLVNSSVFGLFHGKADVFDIDGGMLSRLGNVAQILDDQAGNSVLVALGEGDAQ